MIGDQLLAQDPLYLMGQEAKAAQAPAMQAYAREPGVVFDAMIKLLIGKMRAAGHGSGSETNDKLKLLISQNTVLPAYVNALVKGTNFDGTPLSPETKPAMVAMVRRMMGIQSVLGEQVAGEMGITKEQLEDAISGQPAKETNPAEVEPKGAIGTVIDAVGNRIQGAANAAADWINPSTTTIAGPPPVQEDVVPMTPEGRFRAKHGIGPAKIPKVPKVPKKKKIPKMDVIEGLNP
jgi:hypothetical protein